MSRLPLARVTHRKCQIAANFLVLQRAEAADNRDREERGERGGGRRLSGGISASLWLETGAAFASFILSADLKILPDHGTLKRQLTFFTEENKNPNKNSFNVFSEHNVRRIAGRTNGLFVKFELKSKLAVMEKWRILERKMLTKTS